MSNILNWPDYKVLQVAELELDNELLQRAVKNTVEMLKDSIEVIDPRRVRFVPF